MAKMLTKMLTASEIIENAAFLVMRIVFDSRTLLHGKAPEISGAFDFM